MVDGGRSPCTQDICTGGNRYYRLKCDAIRSRLADGRIGINPVSDPEYANKPRRTARSRQ